MYEGVGGVLLKVGHSMCRHIKVTDRASHLLDLTLRFGQVRPGTNHVCLKDARILSLYRHHGSRISPESIARDPLTALSFEKFHCFIWLS